MKKHLLVAVMISCSALWMGTTMNLFAQGVGINPTGASAVPSAGLDVDFTNKGFLPPRVTTAQRDAIASPAEGLQIYNTESKCVEFFANGNWQPLACACASAPAAPVLASGIISNLCLSQPYNYTVGAVAGASSYNWSIPAGASITGQGTSSVSVTYADNSANQFIHVTASNSCGTGPALNFGMIFTYYTPGTITQTPSGNVCPSQTGLVYSISAVPTALSYTWTVPAGASITSPGSGGTTYTGTQTSITVNWGTTAGTVSVTSNTACSGNSSPATLNVDLAAAPATPGTITQAPSGTVCPSQTGIVYSISPVPTATSYTWSVPSGAVITSPGVGGTTYTGNVTSVTVTWGSTTGNVSVTASSCSGATSTAKTQNVTIAPAPGTPGTITQTPTGICLSQSNVVFSISSVSTAVSYTWSVPSDATITSPGSGGTTYTGTSTSITVTWGSSAGNVTVAATSCSGATSAVKTSAASLASAPSTPGTIAQSPSGTVCPSQSGILFTVPSVANATSYTWTVPSGASITSPGSGSTYTGSSPYIVVNWGTAFSNTNVTVSANSCSGAASSSITKSVSLVGVPTTPGSIVQSPSGNICAGLSGISFTTAPVTNGSSYTWGVPTDATIVSGQGTNSIIVNWGSTTTNISVTAYSCSGTPSASNSTKAVTIASPATATPGTITQTPSGNVCPSTAGVVYSISSVGSATSYTWAVPSGASIISGQGTTSVTVTESNTTGTSNVTVTAANCNNVTASNTLAVTVNSTAPATPGTITQSPSGGVCSGQPGIGYSISAVSPATSYTWAVPGDASITSGQGITSATVTWGSTATNISVTANRCGNSSAAKTLAVAVNGVAGTHGKQVFFYTGSNQTWSVPCGVSSLDVKVWAAGGGSGGGSSNYATGGSGGYVSGTIAVTSGSTLTVIVGQGGSINNATATQYGGGGGAGSGNGNGFGASAGGGRSAIQVSGIDVVTAGGGGGVASISTNAANSNTIGTGYGGGGGDVNGLGVAGTGGSTFTGTTGGSGGSTSGGAAGCYYSVLCGNAGSQYTGGQGGPAAGSDNGGAEGGAIFGGGGGSNGAGGGGGSSYTGNLTGTVVNLPGASNSSGSINNAPNNADGDYSAGVGVGSAYNVATSNAVVGGNGEVVISW